MRVDALHAILILPGTQENLVLVKTMFTENILTLLQVRTIEEIKVRRLARSYLRRLTMKFQVDKTIQANFITSRCNVSIALMALPTEPANFAQFIKLSYWGAISQSERNIAARDRVCNTRSIHRPAPGPARPPPRPARPTRPSSSRPTPVRPTDHLDI